MFYFIRKIKNNYALKRLVVNIFSLSFIKVVGYFFPIIIIPFILNIIGSENYGRYITAFAVIQYLLIIIDYGFQFTGVRDIADTENSKNKIQILYSEIFLARLILMLLTVIFLLVFSIWFTQTPLLYLYGIGVLIGYSMQSLWFYQGMQDMKLITLIVISSKLISFLLTIIFLKKRSDYFFLMLFDSISYLISGFISMVIIYLKFGITLKIASFKGALEQFKKGWNIFISTILISIYRDSNLLILSAISNYTFSSYYGIAERLVKAIQSLSQPITYALFPYFSKNKIIKETKIFFRGLKYLSFIFILIFLIVIIFADDIVYSYLGSGYERVALNIRILSPIILVGMLNYYLGIIGLINLKLDKVFKKFIIYVSFFSLVSCFVLSLFLFDIGASIAFLFSELLLLILIVFKFYNIGFFSKIM
ncbi:MAG: oligosaccharide flippase family protein [Tenuifilum sp.]|uniref:oligosaccharide flippase family protein n=1 Tax=Tenuifilum sp. TaxID=2760880 RepID=UPI003094D343